jgi:hypothetical protein
MMGHLLNYWVIDMTPKTNIRCSLYIEIPFGLPTDTESNRFKAIMDGAA